MTMSDHEACIVDEDGGVCGRDDCPRCGAPLRTTGASFYVHRAKEGKDGWIGPIRSKAQAIEEARAWESCGWDAAVFVSNPSIKRAVALWQKQADERLGRTRQTR